MRKRRKLVSVELVLLQKEFKGKETNTQERVFDSPGLEQKHGLDRVHVIPLSRQKDNKDKIPKQFHLLDPLRVHDRAVSPTYRGLRGGSALATFKTHGIGKERTAATSTPPFPFPPKGVRPPFFVC
ncbi:hypothetical protein JTE90_028433 [Oedothorax gibbosus]|uniref:Uncharacterized protein n=1 Tax=Oedothorax gibbosus TaxID=931172 RepID=A0AAV6VFA1_9ARAC|nr:hypothetical protein JTE90_028433 [Oedothorax gibbosus]